MRKKDTMRRHLETDMEGILEVVVGGMFSGKTEEIIRRGRRAVYAGQRVQVFKHSSDDRYDATRLASHSDNRMEAVALADVEQMRRVILPNTQVLVVDEGQFFKDPLIRLAIEQRKLGRRIIIAGLDMDFEGNPFHPMPTLMAIANLVDKKRAICTKCPNEASFSQRRKRSSAQVLVGETDAYEARCGLHWDPTKFE